MKINSWPFFYTSILILFFGSSEAQVYQFSKNDLQIEVSVKNACDIGVSNGYITFKLKASKSNKARLVLITGPSTTVFPDFDFSLPGNDTYTFVPSAPQNGLYDFVIRDPDNVNDFINTLVTTIDGVELKALPPIILSEASLISNTNCNTPNGQIEAGLSGGSKAPALPVPGSFSYTWTSTYNLSGLPLTGIWDGTGTLNLATLLTRPGLPGGTYTLEVVDNFSHCTATKAFVVVDSSPVAYNVSPASVTGCLSSDLVIQLSNSETALVQYEVFENGNPTGIKLNGASGTLNFTIPGTRFNKDGSYVYTVIATNGICTPIPMTGSTTVTINTKVTINTISTDPKCTNGTDGNITLSASGGSGSFEFSINDGATFQASGIFNGLSAGTYSVTARDNNGCGSDKKTITLNNPDPVSFSSTFTEPSCNMGNDGSITLIGSGGSGVFSFSINNGVSFNNTGLFSNLPAGTYDAIVKDSFGCLSNPVQVIVTEPQPITFTFSTTNPTCLGRSDGSISITAIGGAGSFEYSNNNGTSFSTNSTFQSLAAGSFPLVVKDNKNCKSASSIATLINPPAVTLIVSKTPETCFGSGDATLTLTGAGGTNIFNYSINGGSTFQGSGIFTGLSAGSFSVVAKDSNGCLSNPSSETVLATAKVLTTFTSNDPTTCVPGNDGQFNLTATGGSGTYTFSKDNGLTFNVSGNFNGLSAGSYTVKSKDSNGCLSEPVTIFLKPPFIITVSGNTIATTCNGTADGSIEAASSGGNGSYSYSIDNGITFQASGTFSNLNAGSFSIISKDDVGCVGNSSFTVTEPAILSYTATPDQVSCNGFTDGKIDFIASGGNGGYAYSINNGATFLTTPSFKNLIPGSYAVVVQDLKNCLAPVQNISVIEPAVLTVTASKTDVTLCDPGNDGTLTATVNGGTGPFTYSLDGTTFQASQTFTGLTGGLYTVIAKDSRGCTEFAPISINVPSGPLFFFSVQDLKCFNDKSGSISMTGFGGTSPLVYSINAGLTFQSGGNFTSLAAGDYTLIVQDAKGCRFEIPTSLFQPNEIIPTIINTPILCNGESNATLNITAVGGVTPYEFSINNGTSFSASGSFQNLAAGDYPVVVRDILGCLSTQKPFVISDPPKLQINSSITNAGCTNDNGSVLVTVTGGTAPFSYEFNNNVVALPAGGLFTGLSEGNYPFKVIDSRGCNEQKLFAITFPGNINVNAIGTAPDCTSNGTNGFITVNLSTPGNFQAGISSSTNPPQNFIQVTNGIFNFNNLQNGNYTITIKNNSLCPASIPVNITGGPETVGFTTDVIEKVCFEDRAFIRLSNIIGKTGLNYLAEIKTGNQIYKSQVITSTQANQSVEIEIPDGGSYQLKFTQDQSSISPCLNPIGPAEVSFTMDTPGALLDITEIVKTISLPDLPTGSFAGSVIESTEEPYQVKLELVTPHEQGQNFLSDFEIVQRNSETGKFEFSYTNIYAGDYAFLLKDAFGCEKTYSVTIDFNPQLFIPNIFTPDGDGVNEEFYIRNLPPNCDIHITDRWGQKIFASNNYQNNWTGKGVPDGIYYYKVIIGRKTYNGWVEVLTGK